MNTRQALEASLRATPITMETIAKKAVRTSLRDQARKLFEDASTQWELADLAVTGGDIKAAAMHADHAGRNLQRAAKALKALHENEERK